MDLSVELSVWLGIAGLALIWANLALWRTRHVLKRLQQDHAVPERRLVPDAIAMPADLPEMADAGSP